VLLFESPDGDVLDPPDNIVVTPPRRGPHLRGRLVQRQSVRTTPSRFFGEDKNRLIGLTMRGEAFPFAENMAGSGSGSMRFDEFGE
jgi:hypothetical protein